jgi:ABC-type uncharacterized transport system permease subunit
MRRRHCELVVNMDSSVLLGSNKDIKFYTLGECVTYHIITYVCSPLQNTAVIFLYENPVHHNDCARQSAHRVSVFLHSFGNVKSVLIMFIKKDPHQHSH